MSARADSLLRCTFCERTQDVLKKLIAGPGVYICDECIGLCNDIIESEEPLAQLRTMAARTDALVEQLKADGVPWEEIARALRRTTDED